MSSVAQKTAELAVSPAAYQRTHALAMSAHTAVTAFGGHLEEMARRLEDGERDNVDLWKRVNEIAPRHDALEKQNAQHEAQLQTIRILALVCCGCSFVSVLLTIAGLFVV